MRHIISVRNRAILREMVITDFKLRYRNSALGYLWSIMRPLFMFLILYIVFTGVFKIGNEIPHYPAYLLLGIVLWNFFTEVTSRSLSSIVDRGDLLRKISIPRFLVVLSVSVSALINLAINLVVVFILALFNNVDFGWSVLLFPIVLIELFAFSLAVGFFLAAVFVRLRDISYVWEIILQAGFYATPILYPLAKVPEQFHFLILASPIAQTIQDAREFLITDATVQTWDVAKGLGVIVPFTIAIFVSAYAVFIFKKRQVTFAEDL